MAEHDAEAARVMASGSKDEIESFFLAEVRRRYEQHRRDNPMPPLVVADCASTAITPAAIRRLNAHIAADLMGLMTVKVMQVRTRPEDDAQEAQR